MSLKDKILSALDAKLQALEVPEWEATVFLRVWSGKERAAFQRWFSSSSKDEQAEQLYGRVAVTSLVDETGARLFTDADIPALLDKSGAVLERITLAALRHNGIGPDAIEDAKKN